MHFSVRSAFKGERVLDIINMVILKTTFYIYEEEKCLKPFFTAIINNIFGLLLWLWRLKILGVIEENAYSRKYSTLQLGTHKIGFQCYFNVSVHFRIMSWKLKIIIIKIWKHICYWYVWFKMPFSSLYTLLKMSKTTSPNKLFDYDCVTLYVLQPDKWKQMVSKSASWCINWLREK